MIPLVTHGITFISRLQMWTQPFWLLLHLLPFGFIAFANPQAIKGWVEFAGLGQESGYYFNLTLFGAASSVLFSLIAQIGEQVDFMRFLPAQQPGRRLAWWSAYLSAGPGWIVPGMLKLLAGSFLAYLAVQHMVPVSRAAEPTEMYLHRVPLRVFLAAVRPRLHRRFRHHLADQDQRHQRLCRLDRLVEFLFALDP